MNALAKLRGAVRRLWIGLVIVPVIAVGALVIYRFHGVFGAEQLQLVAGGVERGEVVVVAGDGRGGVGEHAVGRAGGGG